MRVIVIVLQWSLLRTPQFQQMSLKQTNQYLVVSHGIYNNNGYKIFNQVEYLSHNALAPVNISL